VEFDLGDLHKRPRLLGLCIRRYLQGPTTKGQSPMSLSAVAVFLLFIIAVGALNYLHYGRID